MLHDRICTISIHDEAFSADEVLVNLASFPPGLFKANDLIAIATLDSRTVVQDFQDDSQQDGTSNDNALLAPAHRQVSLESNLSSAPKRYNPEDARCYIFILKDISASQKARYPKLEISVAPHVAQAFGFRNRSQVSLSVVERRDHTASHVEISFRDQYLTRSDMWRLAASELCNKAAYKGQRLLHLGSIKATIKNIYVQGHKVKSAYFSGHTKPVFRSESARYVMFIQMSKEMWDFDSDGSGEIMFDKVISGFLPDLFKRWTLMGVKHLVTIVLFTRVEYEISDPIVISPDLGFHGVDSDGKLTGERPPYKDFYRIVVNEMASGEWTTIMFKLRKEYLRFQRDVSTQTTSLRERAHLNTALSLVQEDAEASVPRITGGPSAAIHGNILEAISLASSHFSSDYLDRDLVRTGISIVVVTPGTAIFEVDRDVLRLTTDTVIGNGIGLDIVCLSKMPLHSVPLFKYRDDRADGELITKGADHSDEYLASQRRILGQMKHGSHISPSQFTNLSLSAESKESEFSDGRRWKHAVPNWIDVSFWPGTHDINSVNQRVSSESNAGSTNSRAQSELALRCKMYELQMMGVAENEMSNISIPYLHESYLHPDSNALHEEQERHRNRSGASTPTEKKHRRSNAGLILGLGKNDGFHAKHDRDALRWMDTYDSYVFHSHQKQKANEKGDRMRRRDLERKKRTSQANHDGSYFLGTSYSIRDKSPGARDHRVGSAFFDRQMKERDLQMQLHKSPRNEINGSHFTVTPPSSSLKGADKGRKFSFNIRGFNFSPPSATSLTHTESVSGIIRTEPRTSNHSQRISILSADSPFSGGSSMDNTPPKPSDNLSSLSGSRSKGSKEASSEPINIKRATEPSRDESRSIHSKIHRTSFLDNISKDQLESEKLDVLQSVSRSKHLGPKVDVVVGSAGSSKMSPSAAMAPWLTVLNPLNPKDHDNDTESQFRRWQHIYPKPLRLSSIKWKSLCSPAAIPLTTECFPSARQLTTEYTESPYIVSPIEESDDISEDPIKREALLMELISMRLSQGFQIVVGPAVTAALSHIAQNLVTSLEAHRLAADGATIVMSMGSIIHQIVCMEGGDIQVKRMIRKQSAASTGGVADLKLSYRPLIRTRLSDYYIMQPMQFGNLRSEYNWNYADSLIAGYESTLDEQLRFWRARFVLIPGTPPPGIRRTANLANEDDDEEVRIEGIRKLSQMIQQRSVKREEDKYHNPRRRKKDTNPLGIIYQTRDPSAVVRSELQGLSILGPEESARRSQLFPDTEIFEKSDRNLAAIAQEMQGARGIKMEDRRWHWRLHWNCFIGEEFTTWLLESFQDIETRDEAVELGNELMKLGLFKHVEGRHQFRDGNYYYHLSTEYSAARAEAKSGWFSSMRSEKSVPSTPLSEASRDDTVFDRQLSEKDGSSTADLQSRLPSRVTHRKVNLSKMIRYDVDPRKKSSRAEIINLHYDLLHNPDSCYHLRLEWMNVTPKLIEDVLLTWTSTVERYGLKLMQVPIAEALAVSATNPFRAPYEIKLALTPPEEQPLRVYDPGSLAPQNTRDPLFYHKAVLRHLDFVLDVEAASSFPKDITVQYSWGTPGYRFTQYIHRSGIVLCQIRDDDGAFLLVDNQRCNSRPTREAVKFDRLDMHDRRPPGIAGIVADKLSPYASPHLKATTGASEGISATAGLPTWPPITLGTWAEQVKDEMERFCHDEAALRAFYEKQLKVEDAGDDEAAGVSDDGRANMADDSGIPTLGLPPSLGRGEGLFSVIERSARSDS